MSLCFCSTPSAQPGEPAPWAPVPRHAGGRTSALFQEPRRTPASSPRMLQSFRHWHSSPKRPRESTFSPWCILQKGGSLAGLVADLRAGTAGSPGSHKSRFNQQSWNIPLNNTRLHGTGQVTSTPTAPLLRRHSTCLVVRLQGEKKSSYSKVTAELRPTQRGPAQVQLKSSILRCVTRSGVAKSTVHSQSCFPTLQHPSARWDLP